MCQFPFREHDEEEFWAAHLECLVYKLCFL